MIAEDIEVNQLIIGEMLVALGHEFNIAANGLEAFELYKAGNYDLVFMDCQMPVKDGIQATQEIRLFEKSERSHSRIPIIALTAGVSEKERNTPSFKVA